MYKSISYITLILVLSFFSCETQIDRKDKRIDCLKNIAYSIKNINPSNTSFSDLTFLDSILKNVDIVTLGEVSHGDGSSFLAKTRIIKYLHEKLDFDVLVFESGLFDCFQAWNAIQSGENTDTAFAMGVFPVWAKSVEVKELIDYLEECNKSKNPLELAGFDIQLTGKISIRKRKQMLIDYAKKINPQFKTNDYKHFFMIFDNSKKYLSADKYNPVDSITQKNILTDLNHFEKSIDTTIHNSKEYIIFKRFLNNLSRFLYFIWNMDINNDKIMNIRDKEMGENVIWLKNTIYPKRKMILWGANSHLSYNRNKLFYLDKMIPMGQYIKDVFGSRAFFILLTGFTGKTASIVNNTEKRLPSKNNKSIEYLLHLTGLQNAFITSSALKKAKCMDSIFTARPFGFVDFKAQWTKMADAFLFTDTITPNHKRN